MPKGMLYELRKFYYDTAQAENPLALGALWKLVPVSQMLFGTDFPFGAGGAQEHVKRLQAAGVFNDAELRAVARENAVRLLPRLRV
jgi:6-methylsalicylate decarboxylase